MAEKSKRTISFTIPEIEFNFKLSNLFNRRAICLGALTAVGVAGVGELAWALQNFNIMGGATPALATGTKALLYGGAALTGIWNAHAVGGKTVLFENTPLNSARNLAFLAASASGAAILGTIALSVLIPAVIASNAFPFIAGALALGSATSNAVSLRWKPKKTSEVQAKPQ